MENFEDNLEKEYHERFHDFEEMPNDILWANIQARIEPEQKKRTIFIWWTNTRNRSIAAGILLGFLFGGYLLSSLLDDSKKVSNFNGKTINATTSKQTSAKSTTKSTQIIDNEVNINREKAKKADNNLVELNERRDPIASRAKIAKPNQERVVSENSSAVVSLTKSPTIAENKNSTLINEISSIEIKSPIEGELSKEAGLNTSKMIEFEKLVFLDSRKAKFGNFNKILEIQIASNEPYEIEEPSRERMVFIPPSEVFANVSPMLSYYVFSPNRNDNFMVNNLNGSSNRLSFAAQLGFVYPLTKKLDIRTGLSYMAGKSNISYGVSDLNQKVVKLIDEHTIEVSPANSIYSERKNWQYLELQSDLLYDIRKLQALSLGFRAGIQTDAINKPIFNARLGYLMSKPVNNKIALWIEPSVVFSLSSRHSLDNYFMYHTTGFSLNMGVSLLRQD